MKIDDEAEGRQGGREGGEETLLPIDGASTSASWTASVGQDTADQNDNVRGRSSTGAVGNDRPGGR